MHKADQPVAVAVHDRVTFDSGDGIQVGFVNGLRRDVGNGEMHAWIELDHQLPGMFHAVPLSKILSSDRIEPPSGVWLSVFAHSIARSTIRPTFASTQVLCK